MMIADVVSGIMVAVSRRSLNSSVSLAGMTRKVYMLLAVGVAAVIEPHADDIPLTKLVAGCFVASELLSIVENGVALGVPVPKVFRDTLAKFRDDKEATVRVVEQDLVVKRKPRPSDFVEVHGPPPIQTAEQDGANHPARPS